MEKGLSHIFKQRTNLRDSLNRIENFGRKRVQTLRQLVENSNFKALDAYNRLKQNYLEILKAHMALGGDKIFHQSAQILERTAQKNLRDFFSRDTKVETGLIKLAKLLDFRNKQAEHITLKNLNKSVSEQFRTRRNKLNNLEIIAQNILRSNLKTLTENNRLRKQLLMSSLFSNIERKQKIKLRNAFTHLIRD